MKLVGWLVFRCLRRVFGLPSVAAIDSHPHDVFATPALEALPPLPHLAWRIRRGHGIACAQRRLGPASAAGLRVRRHERTGAAALGIGRCGVVKILIQKRSLYLPESMDAMVRAIEMKARHDANHLPKPAEQATTHRFPTAAEARAFCASGGRFL